MKGKQLSTPSAEKKAAGERKIFQCFLLDLGWSPGEISSEDPPAPDILYKPLDGVPVAFELAEIADEQLASLISKLKSGEIHSDRSEAFNFGNPMPCIIKKKFHKKYQSSYPVNLLLYTNGRYVPPDDIAIELARTWIKTNDVDPPFVSVWFMGEGPPKQIWRRPAQE